MSRTTQTAVVAIPLQERQVTHNLGTNKRNIRTKETYHKGNFIHSTLLCAFFILRSCSHSRQCAFPSFERVHQFATVRLPTKFSTALCILTRAGNQRSRRPYHTPKDDPTVPTANPLKAKAPQAQRCKDARTNSSHRKHQHTGGPAYVNI